MAKIELESELTSKALKALVLLSEKHRGKQFRIDKYTIIPKALYICEGGMYYLLEVFSQSLKNIKAVIIDVAGLHPKYATQLEIYDDGTVIVSPGQNRTKEDVKKFLTTVINSV